MSREAFHNTKVEKKSELTKNPYSLFSALPTTGKERRNIVSTPKWYYIDTR